MKTTSNENKLKRQMTSIMGTSKKNNMKIEDELKNKIEKAGAELGQAQFSYQLVTGLLWN